MRSILVNQASGNSGSKESGVNSFENQYIIKFGYVNPGYLFWWIVPTLVALLLARRSQTANLVSLNHSCGRRCLEYLVS